MVLLQQPKPTMQAVRWEMRSKDPEKAKHIQTQTNDSRACMEEMGVLDELVFASGPDQ